MIRGGTIMVLGGWGLVGRAICHQLLKDEPRRIVICSLQEHEAREAADDLIHEVERLCRHDNKKLKTQMIPVWGDIFSRMEFKNTPPTKITDPAELDRIINDTFNDLNKIDIKQNYLYHLVTKYKPDVLVDAVNTATIVAYKDIYSSVRNLQIHIAEVEKAMPKNPGDAKAVEEYMAKTRDLLQSCREHMTAIYLPKLIRHVQILYLAMQKAGAQFYIKIGTTGTGGMGLNIPYTHSEEKPSQTLLSKSAVAGAHSLLLFLMANTPGTTFTMEMKPAAAIAWKEIGYGEIRKRGSAPIRMVDNPPKNAFAVAESLDLSLTDKQAGDKIASVGDTLKAVYINTGENGLFSLGEFAAITTTGQMEYVTPEEVARTVREEIMGGNTGHDVMSALKNSIIRPSYRAGFMRDLAVTKLTELEAKHGCESVAFEILGPPRLSKLLYEAYLLKSIYRNPENIANADPEAMSKKLVSMITRDAGLRSRIISIGIPILMADGKRMLRGKTIVCPPFRGDNTVALTEKTVNQYAHDGWVDLRVSNMIKWRDRMKRLSAVIADQDWDAPKADTSSRFNRKRLIVKGAKGDEISIGEVVGWIFNDEEGGARWGFDVHSPERTK